MSLLTGVHLSFALSNYRSFISVGEDAYFKIVYDVKHDEWDQLKLKNGNDLLSMPGTIHLRAHDGELDQWNGSPIIGKLDYIESYGGSSDGVVRPSSEHFSIECLVPTDILGRLFDAEKSGLGPTNVGVSVAEGINYGSAPDGSDMIWESDKKWTPVEKMSFTFRRDSSENADSEKDDQEKPQEPQDTLGDVREAIVALNLRIEKSTLWIIGLLALIVGVLAFK
jgi:hypothetical protein